MTQSVTIGQAEQKPPCKNPDCDKTAEQGNVTVSWYGKQVWEGCSNCLALTLIEYKDYADRGIMKCVCVNLWFGCKCGAMQRERYFKKEKLNV